MSSIALVIPVMNHKEDTESCLKSFKETADNWDEIELLLIDNGSTVPVLEWGLEGIKESNVLRNDVNVGVLPALQQGYEQTKSDYIFYTHNDVTMFEQGWDSKLKRLLLYIPRLGVAGFFGSKGIGTPQLYATPYQMNQLIRIENVSGCKRMDSAHNYRPVNGDWEKVAVLDGFALIMNREFLIDNQGFDTQLPPHHMYDNHTCLQAIDKGYQNAVIPMDAFHHGGKTDVTEDWNAPFGKTKQEIHQDAHYPYFYEYWRPGKHNIALPLMVY